MQWCYVIVWCSINLGCFPDFSGFAEELRCPGAQMHVVRRKPNE